MATIRLKYKVDQVEFTVHSHFVGSFFLIRLSPHVLQGAQLQLSSPNLPHPSTILFLSSSKYIISVAHALSTLLGLFNLIW